MQLYTSGCNSGSSPDAVTKGLSLLSVSLRPAKVKVNRRFWTVVRKQRYPKPTLSFKLWVSRFGLGTDTDISTVKRVFGWRLGTDEHFRRYNSREECSSILPAVIQVRVLMPSPVPIVRQGQPPTAPAVPTVGSLLRREI